MTQSYQPLSTASPMTCHITEHGVLILYLASEVLHVPGPWSGPRPTSPVLFLAHSALATLLHCWTLNTQSFFRPRALPWLFLVSDILCLLIGFMFSHFLWGFSSKVTISLGSYLYLNQHPLPSIYPSVFLFFFASLPGFIFLCSSYQSMK